MMDEEEFQAMYEIANTEVKVSNDFFYHHITSSDKEFLFEDKEMEVYNFIYRQEEKL